MSDRGRLAASVRRTLLPPIQSGSAGPTPKDQEKFRHQLLNETGSIAAKPSGGSISPLEVHADVLLALIAEQPDLTLDEIVAAMRKRRIAGSRSAVWRFFKRHNVSFKKTISDSVRLWA